MNNKIQRRDFLKLAGLLPLGFFAPRWMNAVRPASQTDEKRRNVILLVFDAFSAYDIPFYGYQRQTTPNLARLAKRAIVYHSHFAGGNFTSPGTASLLTGTLPWTHRAFAKNATVEEVRAEHNIFQAFDDYYRVAYTHNAFANTLLTQFASGLDDFIPRMSLYLKSYDSLISTLFEKDEDIASVSWIRSMKTSEEGASYSLFLSHLYEALQDRRLRSLKPRFPRGLPMYGESNPFLLETAIDKIGELLPNLPQPFIGYFHLLPPHGPYHTPSQFVDVFKNDGLKFIEKPLEVLLNQKVAKGQAESRTEYDEYILYCDQQFEKLFGDLEKAGLLENSWVILTSDHGEMFERGISGHGSKVLYQPVIRIPLIIFEPGRRTGMEIHDHTSAVDLLPTLAHLTGRKIPDWVEGKILPPFAPSASDRSVFAVQAMKNAPHHPLLQASLVLVKQEYKLHYYFGYPELAEGKTVKLFDIRSDPEEMVDLSTTRRSVALELLDELNAEIRRVDEPYVP